MHGGCLMFGLSGFKLFGALGAAAALMFMTWATLDRFDLAGKLDDMRDARAACVAAATDASKPTADCPAEVATAIENARAAAVCDIAIGTPRDVALFAVRTACSAPVKRLFADRDAKANEAASARAAIAELRAGQTDAVRRAEARGSAQSTRRDRSDAAIRAAPAAGDAGGNRARCNAECLRNLG